MTRRSIAALLTTLLTTPGCGGQSGQPPATAPAGDAAPFTIVETDIATLQQALQSGRVTSRQLTERYLERIATYEDRLNAIITVNPKALAEADRMDQERADGRVRGPLHGIPIALKDNVHTTDIRTTGGALAFRDLVPPYDATLTKNLRDGGAVIIAKTVLTELAHWTAGAPTPMVANYTGVAGFAYNPYDPRMDPRDETFDGRPVLATGGSSSGTGTAASFWAASVGSDTGGSIISPSNANMLVGIRPTIGRISRYGVIPITADHDTAGPMARTVRDAAVLMGVLESAAPDPNDAATRACTPPANRDYTAFLDAGALKGARIGVPRAFYIDPVTAPGEKTPRGGLNPDQAKVMAEAIALLKAQGAEVVDPADVPSIVATAAADNFLLFDYCQGAEHKKGGDANCTVNFKYGMKRDFNAWLASLGPAAPVKSLTELRQWNLRPRQGRCDALRPVAARHLGRDGRREGQGAQRHRRGQGQPLEPRSGHRRGAEGAQARRDPHAGRHRGEPDLAGRLSDHRRAVRDGAQRADPAAAGRVQRQAGALRGGAAPARPAPSRG